MFLLPHLGTIIWTIIIFGVVVLIMGKYAWKPLLKAISERERYIDVSLRKASHAQELLKNLKAKQDEVLKKVRFEKGEMLKEGALQRDKLIAEAKDKARTEADRIIAEAHEKIKKEREAALVDMRNQITTLSIEIATKVVSADMKDKKRHQEMVKKLIDDIELN
ncbi:MAG: F0F1 ATP synthase subunit B [Prolixibacteraceae bacterium]|jgi:F-type H+-transporting ATPase subunit b|nr:F0F1 ATP synthase subunit B [Prolixibacteraceae bacterium]